MQWGSVAELIGAVAALVGIVVAYVQLKNLADSYRVSSITALLQLESDMNQRKNEAVAASVKLLEAFPDLTAELSPDRQKVRELLECQREVCNESWFNITDRLAFCFRNEYFSGDAWIEDYYPMFSSMLGTHVEISRADSPYDNIKYVVKRWKPEYARIKSACNECGNIHS